MFSIGDTVFYGAHGVCVIDDIEEQSFSGKTKSYYILRSYHDLTLKLFHPVDAVESKLTAIPSKDKANLILESFNNPPDEWTERVNERSQIYQRILESENHLRIAQMMNTILRKKRELELVNKKLANQDLQILKQVSPILYKELSVSLDIPVEEVEKKVEEIIKKNLNA